MRRREVLRTAGTALSLAPVGVAGVAGGRPADEPYEPLATLSLPRLRELVVDDAGTTAYGAVMDGFAAVDVSDPAAPRVLAERRDLLAARDDGPMVGIQDVSVDGDRLLVVGPANPVAADRIRAAVVYDVSDPAAPARVAVHETAFPIHNAFVADGVAYLTGNDREAEPLVLVDLEGGEVGRWSPVDHDERWREVHPLLRQLHDVVVHDDLAVCSYWDAGTFLVDVSDPADPSYVGRAGGRTIDALVEDAGRVRSAVLGLPGNHHSAAVSGSGTLLAVGKEAWSSDPANAPGGIDLWDVSAPADPVHRAHVPPPPTRDPARDGLWTTAHNFDLAGGRLYSAWYRGGVKIHDVADPSAPAELAWWRRPDVAQFWTAVRARDGVVASDMSVSRRSDVEGGGVLYTFPDRPGVQPDPPSLTATPRPTRSPATGSPVSPGASPSPPPGNGTEGTARPTSPHSSGGPSPTTATPDPAGSRTPRPDGTTASPGQPGFGALAALVAAFGARWLASRRHQ